MYGYTVRYFLSDETQLRNGKMAAVYLVKSTKLLNKISYFPGFLIASSNAVWGNGYKFFNTFFNSPFDKLSKNVQ